MIRSSENAIVVEALTKDYGELRAVSDVSFTVEQGEAFAFLGRNGAGKSTTVEIIETIRKATSGKVMVLGMDVATKKREIIPRIGVLPQGFNSFDRLTVAESVKYYARLFGRRAADVDGLMDLTDLRENRDVQFKNLSGGLKQRLGIAIALVNDPEVVFLDEPTTGLDPHARRAVWDVLQDLKHKGKTVFLTTHYMEEAELLADTVAIISKGRIVALGSPDDLINQHANYIYLTLKPADASVLKMIARIGFDPIGDDHGAITVLVRHTEDIHNILGAIVADNMPLPALDVRKTSLEEVFLGLTGKESGAHALESGGPA